MQMGNYYSYKRISTDTEKQSFARQEKALKKYAENNKVEYLVEFKEEMSAKNFTDRKEFGKLDKGPCSRGRRARQSRRTPRRCRPAGRR